MIRNSKTGKQRSLSTKKWSLYQRHVCFCNPCARAESHQRERARKLWSATLTTERKATVNHTFQMYRWRKKQHQSSNYMKTDCSQLRIFSYFYSIVKRADRITRQLDASAKRKTWLDRQTPPLPPRASRSLHLLFLSRATCVNRGCKQSNGRKFKQLLT